MACVAIGCVAPTAEEGDKTAARLESGKADDGIDLCERHAWYGDGECDEFCPSPDADCAFDAMCRVDDDCPIINCVQAPCPSNSCIDGACQIDSPVDACPPGERQCDGCLGETICVSHRLDCPMLLCPDLNECRTTMDCPVLNCVRAPCPTNECVEGVCVAELPAEPVEDECRTSMDCPVIDCVRAPCPTNACVEGACVAELPMDDECRDDERVCEGCLGVLFAASVCGDGIVSGDEQCDGGDDCTAECTFADECRDDERVCVGCLGVLFCSPGDLECPQVRCAASVCGDGVVSGDEQCDGGDGCTAECMFSRDR